MNLLEQQAMNRRRTWMVMAAFVAFLVVLGAGFDLFVVGDGATYVPVGSTFAALRRRWTGLVEPSTRGSGRSALGQRGRCRVAPRVRKQ